MQLQIHPTISLAAEDFAELIMRNIVITLLLLLLPNLCEAQDYKPTTNWPYLMDDFKQGIIMREDSTVSNEMMMNIHLEGNTLQCIDANGRISRAAIGNIDHISIDEKIFRVIDGKMMQCIYEEDNCGIYHNVKADFEDMLRSRMPYGMSGSTSASMIVQTLGLKGVSNERYEEVRKTWFDGLSIPLIETYILQINGKEIPATQKGCNNVLISAQRKELKQLVKSKDIQWHSVDDLKTIMTFMKKAMIQQP